MKMNSKLGLITMCAKAGRLSLGMDMAKDACRSGSAKGLFVSTDLSEKSLKEMKYYSARYGVKLWSLGVGMDEIQSGLGRRTGIIAINDAGFAASCAKGLTQIDVSDIQF
ncbi:MAG: 50S ribosomal protein L7 [Ruminococcus sp.]|nr:50S ribosomal protein L7 [Ruminococcus sp.]